MRVDIKTLKAQACGRWGSIAASIAPELGVAIKSIGIHVPCPVHGGSDGFRLFADFSQSGGGICNSCGAKADGFELLTWVTGKKFGEVVREVSEAINGPEVADVQVEYVRPERKPSCTSGKNTQRLRRVWQDAHDGPITTLVLGRYLASRGLPASLVSACAGKIRVHESLACWQRDKETKELKNYGQFYALVSLVETMDAQGLTIHRTFLESCNTGWRKARNIPNSKTIMPIKSNMVWETCAIKLGKNPDATLSIAEGIETSLAVIAMGQPHCWSAINANNIAHFTPPAGVKKIVLWADKDAPDEKGICAGAAAAERLRNHLEKLGGNITLEVKYPPMAIPKNSKGVDWLDYYNTLPPKQK